MAALTAADLYEDMKVELDVKTAISSYKMKAVVWNIRDNGIITFRNIKTHIFVFFSVEALESGMLTVTELE